MSLFGDQIVEYNADHSMSIMRRSKGEKKCPSAAGVPKAPLG